MKYSPRLPRFTDLTLILTEQCNLRCPFCYVPKTDRTMSTEVAQKAVDFLADRAPAGARLSIGFFGGEPFVARSLMQEVIAYGRKRCPSKLRFTTPTNGTLLDDAAYELIRDSDMRLALSVDQAEGRQRSLQQLTPTLPRLRQLSPIVRMTVTPHNVDGLFTSIVSCFEQGLSTIMHQPALEDRWPESAVQAWKHQHRLIADWACERYERGEVLPKLTVLEGIVSRLGGQGAGYCGAGVRMVTVDPEGRLFACYRSAYDPQANRLVLGDLRDGSVNETLLAAYSRLHPARARPELREQCKGCEARSGCTVYCAAMGHVLLGDLRAVPADACTLMRIQVDQCQDLIRRMRKLQRAARLRRASSRVAAAALALSLAGGAPGCDSDRAVTGDGGVTDSRGEQVLDGTIPGLCDAPAPDMIGPGLCPVETDLGLDMIPGLCDAGVELDYMVDTNPDLMGPGVCPVPQPDGMVPQPDGMVPQPDGMVPGVCPVPQPDGMVPGVCTQATDIQATDAQATDIQATDSQVTDAQAADFPWPGPGLCPFPGLC
jgi:uncharacterized protein